MHSREKWSRFEDSTSDRVTFQSAILISIVHLQFDVKAEVEWNSCKSNRQKTTINC